MAYVSSVCRTRGGGLKPQKSLPQIRLWCCGLAPCIIIQQLWSILIIVTVIIPRCTCKFLPVRNLQFIGATQRCRSHHSCQIVRFVQKMSYLDLWSTMRMKTKNPLFRHRTLLVRVSASLMKGGFMHKPSCGRHTNYYFSVVSKLAHAKVVCPMSVMKNHILCKSKSGQPKARILIQ